MINSNRSDVTDKQGRFLRTWRVLARRGQCDAAGSAEYRRVCRLWIAQGMPSEMAAFIKINANAGPAE